MCINSVPIYISKGLAFFKMSCIYFSCSLCSPGLMCSLKESQIIINNIYIGMNIYIPIYTIYIIYIYNTHTHIFQSHTHNMRTYAWLKFEYWSVFTAEKNSKEIIHFISVYALFSTIRSYFEYKYIPSASYFIYSSQMHCK